MKLFRAFSIIKSARLLSGQNPENFVKVDWVCYLRDEPLVPFESLIEGYLELPETGKKSYGLNGEPTIFCLKPKSKSLRSMLKKNILPPLK